MRSKYFKYQKIDPSLLKELIDLEPRLVKYIDLNQPFYFRVMPNHFHCLVHTIVSQQLSNAAVDAIWTKLTNKFKKINPKVIANAFLESLRDIGFSENKIKCLKQMSYDICDKKLNLKKLEKLPNEKIYDILTKYHNIGNWSVDMLLIFSYYRNNIISYSDYGIKKGLKILYNTNKVDECLITKVNKKFNNHLTLLGLILWKISNEN